MAKTTPPKPDQSPPEEPKPKHPGGRPPIWTPEKKAEAKAAILKGMADGISANKFCQTSMEQYGYILDRHTIVLWQSEDDEFASSFARARLLYADAIHDESMDIADDDKGDHVLMEYGKANAEGVRPVKLVFVKENVQRTRVRVETRLKVAARLNPKKYSDRLGLDIADERPTSRLTDAQLNGMMAQRIEAVGLVPLLQSFDLTREQIMMAVSLFVIPELPTKAPEPLTLEHRPIGGANGED